MITQVATGEPVRAWPRVETDDGRPGSTRREANGGNGHEFGVGVNRAIGAGDGARLVDRAGTGAGEPACRNADARIDTVISGEETAAYYQDNKALFILDDPLCKARFIKMGRQSPYLPIIKTIYRSNGMEDIAQLERLCESSAEVYKTYSNTWIGVSELAQDLPLGKDEVRKALRPDGYIETTDSLYTYLVNIYEFIPAGHPAPLEYKESNIKQIILSKRKQSLLKDLETEVLKEGWNRQMIKIYKKNED